MGSQITARRGIALAQKNCLPAMGKPVSKSVMSSCGLTANATPCKPTTG